MKQFLKLFEESNTDILFNVFDMYSICLMPRPSLFASISIVRQNCCSSRRRGWYAVTKCGKTILTLKTPTTEVVKNVSR